MNTNNTNSEILDMDLQKIFTIFWKKKINIALISIIFSALSFAYSLTLTNIYQSNALLVLSENYKNESIQMPSSANLLSSLGGFQTGDMRSLDEATAILSSRNFVDHLSKHQGFVESIIASQKYDKKNKQIIFDESIYDKKNNIWLRDKTNYESVIPSNEEIHKKLHDEILTIKVDQRSGFMTISAKHLSPVFAHDLIRILVADLNKIVKEYEITRSQKALENLREKFSNEKIDDIRTSLINLMEIQLSNIVFATIDENYLVRYIDEPYVPIQKFRPSRLFITILGGIIGAFIGLFISIYFSRKEN